MPAFGRRANECMHCGGPVDADGFAFGGEVKPEEEHKSYNEIENAIDDRAKEDADDDDTINLDEDNEIQHKARLAQAIRRRKR